MNPKTYQIPGIEDLFEVALTTNYSDSTSDITYTYFRHGGQSTVADGLGTRNFAYNADLSPSQETLPTSFYGTSKYVKTNYGTGNNAGRFAGYRYTDNITDKVNVTYGFDGATGRISTVLTPAGTFEYGYADNSSRVDEIKLGSSGVYYMHTKTYNFSRNLLASIEAKNQTGANSVAKYAYDYNSLRQRSAVHRTGDIFDGYGGHGIRTNYFYDERGQLKEAATYQRTSSGGITGPALSGRHHTYLYDEAGNRREATTDALTPKNWERNSLNQITERGEPPKFGIHGFLDSSAYTAKIDGVNAQKTNRYFHGYHTVSDNIGNADYESGQLQVYDGTTLLSSTSVSDLVLENLEDYSYDFDGNLKNDAKWDYTYDAENRVTSILIRSYSELGVSLPDSRLRYYSFKYDYLGRLVWIAVYADDEAELDNLLFRYRLVYHGWKMIAALSSPYAFQRSYSWGLDILDSLDASGGVGALLAVGDATAANCYLPFYDGNGNSAGYLDHNAHQVAASFEYNPFGEMIREVYHGAAEEAVLGDLLFAFSSKLRFADTNLYHYGFRMYDSRNGRFLNRDPIGEAGGVNLYGFVGNDPVNSWDYLGLIETLEPFEVVESVGDWFDRGQVMSNSPFLSEKAMSEGIGGGVFFIGRIDPPKRKKDPYKNSPITVAGGTRYDFTSTWIDPATGKPIVGTTIHGTQGIRQLNNYIHSQIKMGVPLGYLLNLFPKVGRIMNSSTLGGGVMDLSRILFEEMTFAGYADDGSGSSANRNDQASSRGIGLIYPGWDNAFFSVAGYVQSGWRSPGDSYVGGVLNMPLTTSAKIFFVTLAVSSSPMVFETGGVLVSTYSSLLPGKRELIKFLIHAALNSLPSDPRHTQPPPDPPPYRIPADDPDWTEQEGLSPILRPPGFGP